MKASDYIADVLHAQGVTVVFEMIGGMITHLIDSIYQRDQIQIISMHHEQAAGFAAEAAARISGVPGVALATSGPGATNLVTAIGSCYFDSVPTVFITGQVNTGERSSGRALRQQGFQETDIVSIVKPITKAAWQVDDIEQLPVILNHAFQLAQEGRPGPVLVDLPMNIQREEIEPVPMPVSESSSPAGADLSEFCRQVADAFHAAEKPLILAGGGIRSNDAASVWREVAETLGVPVVLSLMGLDLLPYDHPQRVGMIGTYGNRWANQALMESDMVLVLGSRLDVRQTGADAEGFGRGRTIFHVDCDSEQLNNRVTGSRTCLAELREFLPELLTVLGKKPPSLCPEWMAWIAQQRDCLPDTGELSDCKGINPNEFIHALSRASAEAGAFLADVGKNQMWTAQSLELKEAQRFLVSGGMGSMGFALPAAIGSVFASGRPAVCIAGDGGLQCNVQELETVSYHKLPVKMVVLNNNSLGMVGQFQKEYFGARMQSTIWGYSAPDFAAVARAYGISSKTVGSPDEVPDAIDWLWEDPASPALLNVMIDVDTKVFPKAVYGRAINDMDPRVD